MLLLVGCDAQNKTNDETMAMINSTKPYFSLEPVTYDYYEIANDTILHTSINTDMINVSRLTVVNEDNQYIKNLYLKRIKMILKKDNSKFDNL